MVSLSAGFPPPHVFPLSSLSFTLTDGTAVSIPDMVAAQQYNAALRGYPPLVHWATAHVAALHRPPSPHDILITNGANHSLELITSLFLDRGDTILVEQYTYPVILESIALPKGLRPLAVPMDGSGIIPEGLQQVLEQAAVAAANGGPPPPKLLYTIPTGHNPTGCTITPERKREVYRLCRQYDVWILEDDPYFYLQWGSAAAKLLESDPDAVSEDVLRGVMPGLAGLAPASPLTTSPVNGTTTSTAPAGSYLGLDIDGRVIRVDSFAKFLAPGLRLGWVTARTDVIDKLTSALQTHTVGPCSLSQTVVASALAAWGDAGLDRHLRQIQAEYARRCAVLCCAASRELSGLAEWQAPRAGMFLWVKLLGVEDALEVWDATHDAKVIVCPGRVMATAAAAGEKVISPYVRIAYSSAELPALKEGMIRLGKVLRKYGQPVDMA